MKPLKFIGYTLVLGTVLGVSHASSYKPPVAENGTYQGQINTKTYKPKNTYVKPYTKKSGQKVRSYYRTKNR